MDKNLKIVLILLVAVLAFVWYDFNIRQTSTSEAAYQQDTPIENSRNVELAEDIVTVNHFKCDGRTYCSQMTSCEEAKFFLKNCPGPKMDGDGDGVPCERQWCN